MRGKVPGWSQNPDLSGITPAYAGKSRDLSACRRKCKDHPRLCGEKWSRMCTAITSGRITPAYAGKSLHKIGIDNLYKDHPRLCGEKVGIQKTAVRSLGSPPPMRGKVEDAENVTKEDRITPAYAGKSYPRCQRDALWRDHPRLCGEKRKRRHARLSSWGSPPPMRGKEAVVIGYGDFCGITPAYAGKRVALHLHIGFRRDHPRLCGEKSYP